MQSIRPRATATGRGGPRGGGGGGGARRLRTCSTRAPKISTGSTGTPVPALAAQPSIIWLGGNGCSSRYNRGDTWTASADLTKQVDRNTLSVMGVPGNRTMLSKNDGVVAYSTIIAVSESPVMPGVVLGRHR